MSKLINTMDKLIDEIMNAQLNRYEIEIYLISNITVKVDCCECFFAFDHETHELEVHREEDREFLDNPILSIKQEDIVAWR